jgi:MoaA/NifB/PqqE/SkfB family radical SAM enzyme
MARFSSLALGKHVFFHHLLSTRKRPLLASYKLSYHCNLRCQQCPFPGFSASEPTFEQACQVLDQLALRGSRLVIFEGGEPLLWQDGAARFSDLVGYARRRFACVGVTTNGTIPGDPATDLLWVSLDGFAETHNRLRGANIFERVIQNIRQSEHPRLYAHITANAENAAEIPALIRFLSGMVKGITLQFYYPYGSQQAADNNCIGEDSRAGDADPLFLPWPERRALLKQVIDLKRQGYPVLNSTAALRALQNNSWRCLAWLVDCANPDGSIHQGCYLHGRAVIDCQKCGFSPYTEISLAFRGNPGAILAGMKIFTTR